MEMIENKGIHNLSNHTLTDTETTLLSLGLRFILEPRDVTNKEVLLALDQFKRTIRLKKQFIHNDNISSNPLLRVPNPHYQPPPAGDILETYLKQTERKIIRALSHTPYRHRCIPKALSIAIQSLLNNKHIIIKNADKNLGTVIVDKEWYEREALKQLSDPTTYKTLDEPPDFDSSYNSLCEILRTHNELHTGNTEKLTPLASYCLQLRDTHKVRCARFYMTIKIHKKEIAGRPICSSINTVTYHTSRYVDSILQPYMKRALSYVKSSFHLICHLADKKFPATCVILTADVESLYPSIEIQRGLDALNYALIQCKCDNTQRIFIIALTKWILENNFIEFGTNLYQQIKGTAMGTPMAVSYANIFLATTEHFVFKICVRTHTHFSMPYIYKRYIDDLFSVFPNHDSATAFISAFNNIQPGVLRLTHLISTTDGVFLDIEAYKCPIPNTHNLVTINTRLYQKPINKYLYLPYCSAHSKKVMKGFITAELQRFRICCTDEHDFLTVKTLFHNRLLARGYPPDILDDWMSRETTDRPTLISRRLQQERDKQNLKQAPTPTIFKIRQSQRTTRLQLNHCLSTHDTASFDPDAPAIFSNREPVLCLVRPTNLGEILTTAKYR
jgi:hypothetical protein